MEKGIVKLMMLHKVACAGECFMNCTYLIGGHEMCGK